MNVFLILSLLFIAVSGVFASLRHIQMFQQNSYFLNRYFSWAKENIKARFYFSLTIALIEICFIVFKLYVPLFILSLFELAIRITAALSTQKKSIKKLVFTHRIIRLICALSTFYAILFLVIALVNKFSIIFTTVCAIYILLSHIPAAKLFAGAFLMSFIEKAISNGYLKDAKRILAGYDNLIKIGITGSYGKTSVKFILKRILSEKYNVVATPESYNTPLGIIRTIREHFAPETEVFIAEMGAKKPYDIKEICDIVKPNIGIITAVGPQHLESFKSIENIKKTKFELADECKNVYVNFESAAAKEKAGEYVTHSYGLCDDYETYAKNIKITEHGTEFDVSHFGREFHITTKLLGLHNVVNIVGAIAIALELNVDENKIRYAVSNLSPYEHRLQKKSFINGSILLDDSYNSNPEGSLAAVKILAEFKNKKKIIVTPGMVELGSREYEYNYNFGSACANVADYLILVGEQRSKPMFAAASEIGFDKDKLFVVKQFSNALELLNKLCDNNTIVLFENDLPDNYAG